MSYCQQWTLPIDLTLFQDKSEVDECQYVGIFIISVIMLAIFMMGDFLSFNDFAILILHCSRISLRLVSVSMPRALILNVFMLSAFILSIFMQTAFILSIFMLSVFMMSVSMPANDFLHCSRISLRLMSEWKERDEMWGWPQRSAPSSRSSSYLIHLGPMLQNFLRSQFTNLRNKLECLSLESFSSLV